MDQPDFIGTELGKCTNMPSVQGGDAILTVLQTLTTEVRTLSTKLMASEHNNAARVQNRTAKTSDTPLTSLHDTENNPINSFPATPAALQQLGGSQLGELLVALSLPNNGSFEEKRLRLRVAIGLRDRPIP